MKKTVYEAVQGKIIEDIQKVIDGEKTLLPWQKGWVGGEPPQNPMTGTIYKGSNVMMLNHMADTKEYKTNNWLSAGFKKKGARVKKSEYFKKQWVIHYHRVTFEDRETGEARGYPQIKSWPVWNLDQFEDLGDIKIPEVEDKKGLDFIPHEESMRVINKYIESDEVGLELVHKGNSAFYRPSQHRITMPPIDQFTDEEAYPMTLFHEAVHSTGHHALLDRKMTGPTSKKDYSCEELVAEMGSQFLANICGLEINYENSLEYMRGWLSAIEMNPKWIIQAGAKAQKAVNWILGEDNE